MTFSFDTSQMEELMKSFYVLSGIRFVLFDADFHEIYSYPKESCDFCKLMKGCAKTRRKCNYADRRSFKKCEQSNSLVLYKCHAGLVEAAIPLHENEKIIGYMMFGQITDSPNKTALYENVSYWKNSCGIDRNALSKAIEKITYKPESQIDAAVKIMEACTSYIIHKELITPENSKIIETAKAYIEEHLGEELSIEQICEDLKLSRTRLYEIFKKELKTGIAKYILRRRMHRAKKLLRTTDLSVKEVADAVGFADYNYFSRVFKKTYGRAAKSYRK